MEPTIQTGVLARPSKEGADLARGPRVRTPASPPQSPTWTSTKSRIADTVAAGYNHATLEVESSNMNDATQ